MTDPPDDVPIERRGSEAGAGLRTMIERLQGRAPLDWLTDVHKPVGKADMGKRCARAQRLAYEHEHEHLTQALRQALITQLTHTQGPGLSPSERARLMGWDI